MELDGAIYEIRVDNSCGSSNEIECKNDLDTNVDVHELYVKSLKERVHKEGVSLFKALDEK